MLYGRFLQNVEHFTVFKNIDILFCRICAVILLECYSLYNITESIVALFYKILITFDIFNQQVATHEKQHPEIMYLTSFKLTTVVIHVPNILLSEDLFVLFLHCYLFV